MLEVEVDERMVAYILFPSPRSESTQAEVNR